MRNTAFLEWLEDWYRDLPALAWADVVEDPNRVAIVSSDLIKGFCYLGPLASPRIAGIIPAAVRIFERAHELGVWHFILTEDAHEPDAVEFDAYPAHSVAGSPESETIDELVALPFSDQFTVMPKNSISVSIGTGMGDWLAEHPEADTFIVVGDCTDICVYQAAMYLRIRANVLGQGDARVIVPENAVQTYDMPVDTALEIGALPHDGDFLHRIFLYHMALNGIEIVSKIG
jgi:nicotinamidase-related amidase